MNSASILAAATLATTFQAEPRPDELAALQSQQLWQVAQDTGLLAAVSSPRPTIAPQQPVYANVWIFMGMEDGYDTMVSLSQIDCANRTILHSGFVAFAGDTYVGFQPSSSSAPEATEPDTVFGAVVAHVCTPVDAATGPEFDDFSQARAAFATHAAPSGR